MVLLSSATVGCSFGSHVGDGKLLEVLAAVSPSTSFTHGYGHSHRAFYVLQNGQGCQELLLPSGMELGASSWNSERIVGKFARLVLTGWELLYIP